MNRPLARILVRLSFLGLLTSVSPQVNSLMAQGRNLLRNPDLSEGLLAPKAWGFNASQNNRARWERDGKGHRFSVLLQGSGRDWAGLSSWAFPVEPGQGLQVAAWIQNASEVPTDARDALYLRFFHNGVFVKQEGPSLEGLNLSWQRLEGEVRVPEDCNQADVSVQIWSKASVRIACLCALRKDDSRGLARHPLPSPPNRNIRWTPVTEPQNLPEDKDENGLPDVLERVLEIKPEDCAKSVRLTRRKTTSFQTSTGYREDNDIKTDIAIVADCQELKIRSWEATGYEPHVMVGFRAGPAYVEGNGNEDEVQQDREGRRLTCGPNSFYMVPTENRRRIFREYFKQAAERGSRAACPEEPEFFGRAGYSNAFKREWKAFYGEPWQDPASSVHARTKAAQLMTRLETRLLENCWESAREVRPDMQRFLLTHTPLNYAHWGIVFGHHDTLKTGMVDALVAQVWTGTARTPVTYAGDTRERTFENAYLEYASAVGLLQGLDVDLWFLMDPLEDNPDRTMEDYRTNYRRTVAAALLFPQVIRYETMPWPTRIYGRVPDDFATEIGNVIQVLSHMQRFEKKGKLDPASSIGVFLSDTALWQRSPPHASSMDSFYGLSLPLVMKGIAISVPHLDRVTDPGYLDPYRVLLLSYDPLKPKTKKINVSLAEWVRGGGTLILFGGDDPYNSVASWWHDEGHVGAQEDLLKRCGWDVSRRKVLKGLADEDAWTVAAESLYKGRDLKNRTLEQIDLSPFLDEGNVLVKCEDSDQQDGWGAYISAIRFSGQRDGVPVEDRIQPNSEEERSLVYLERKTGLHPNARFCDRNSFVIYKFSFDPGTNATLTLDVGNEYRISLLSGLQPVVRQFQAVSEKAAPWGRTVPWRTADPWVAYDNSGAAPLYSEKRPLLSEKRHGEGTVLFCGIPPESFAESPRRAEQLRQLVRYAWEEKQGQPWRTSSHFIAERGPYLAVKTLDKSLSLKGPFLDLLDARLPVLDNKSMDEDAVSLLLRIPNEKEMTPTVLFCSSCLEWWDLDRNRLRLIVSGPANTTGSCRLGLGKAQLKRIRCCNVKGETPGSRCTRERGTVLLQYPNEPRGLAIQVLFHPSS